MTVDLKSTPLEPLALQARVVQYLQRFEVVPRQAPDAVLGPVDAMLDRFWRYLIGQLLRHRRALTTAIYAKVDRDTLRMIARPWPGDAA